MDILLKNGQPVLIRHLKSGDIQNLFNYLSSFSDATKSCFGPHPFDFGTVQNICNNLQNDDVMRYIAVEANVNIIAYMLFKQGMIEEDKNRYTARNQFYDYHNSVTYAPSVADAYQSSGVGGAMYLQIEPQLKEKGIKHIILWGGVQATNERAVNFYKKFSYELKGSFWHNEKDNFDMVKGLT